MCGEEGSNLYADGCVMAAGGERESPRRARSNALVRNHDVALPRAYTGPIEQAFLSEWNVT